MEGAPEKRNIPSPPTSPRCAVPLPCPLPDRNACAARKTTSMLPVHAPAHRKNPLLGQQHRLPKTFLGRKERLPAFHSSAASSSSCGREKRRPETRFLLHGKAKAARRSPLPDGSEDADPPLLFLCRITVFPVRQALHGEGKAPSSCGRKVPGLSDAKRAALSSGPPLFLARAADGPVPDASADTKALNDERLLKKEPF